MIKYDLETETYEVHAYSSGAGALAVDGGGGDGRSGAHGAVRGGENMFARRSLEAEDDGWLLSFTCVRARVCAFLCACARAPRLCA